METLKTNPLVLGDKLAVGAVNCFQCHYRMGKAPPDQPIAWAPDLALADERLREDWLHEWLVNPQAFYPGTAMPANFGAQPPCRAEDGYFSYVYTDRGRDYRSHHWDGKVIKVHKAAMNIDGALEFLLTEREVGILSDLQLRHLLARGRNPKEKPIERLFKDISDWERNSFKEYCGRNAAERPEAWRRLYARHQQFGGFVGREAFAAAQAFTPTPHLVTLGNQA